MTAVRAELLQLARAYKALEIKAHKASFAEPGGLLRFVEYFWDVLEPTTPFISGWVIDGMCEHLEAIADGELHRLLMNVSPGFMKSLLCNVFFPAWLWSAKERPEARFIAFSYSAHLTERDNEKFRDLIRSRKFQEMYGSQLTLTREGTTKVANNKTGWKFASSVGGVGTGERADFILCDDPHNVTEAESDTVRTDTVRWFRESMQNRLNDLQSGVIIVIMQRVHENDVSGAIIENYPEYEHFCYDAETEILSRRGWLLFKDLSAEDEVLAADPKTLKLTWERPSQRVSYPYKGALLNYSSAVASLAVTPDHRMVYKDYNDWETDKLTEWRVAPAHTLPKHFYLPQAGQWDGVDPEQIEFGGKIWRPEVLADFLGWYLAEGNANAKTCATRIIQSAGVLADEIENVLKESPFEFRIVQRPGELLEFAIGSKPLASALAVLGLSVRRVMPTFVKDWPPTLLKRVFTAFAKGDGCAAGRNGTGVRLSSRSSKLIDDFQEICLKCGWASTKHREIRPAKILYGYDLPEHDFFHLYIRYSKAASHAHKWYAKIRKENVSEVDYDGMVYCVSVPSTAVVVRRRGRVSISGNCIPMEYEGPERKCETSIGWADPREEDGELAWPERYPDGVLEPFRSLPHLWATQYQQRPEPRGGGIIKRDYWRIWDRAAQQANDVKPGMFPAFEYILASFDGAFTENEENDYSALSVWGVWTETTADQRAQPHVFGTPRLMLIDAWRKRLTLHGRTSTLFKRHDETDAEFKKRQEQHWGVVQHIVNSCRKHKVDHLLIEKKATGHTIEQEMRRLFSDEDYTIELVDPGRLDKVSRAWSVQPLFVEGTIWRPETAAAQLVEDELASLPRGAHDDLADTATQSIIKLRRTGMAQRPSEAERGVEEKLYGKRRPKRSLYES